MMFLQTKLALPVITLVKIVLLVEVIHSAHHVIQIQMRTEHIQEGLQELVLVISIFMMTL